MIFTFKNIPINLSEKLVEEYLEIKKRHSMSDWGPSQLKGGRFAEAMLRIFQHLLGISITPFGTNIPNKDRILNAVKIHPSLDDHIRQKVAPLIRLLLDFRNNRDVAHLGGFNANSMDTLFVMTTATWILCELIRVYGGQSMDTAQKLVDSLSVKEYPVLMEFEGELFITRHNLNAEQEVLIFLYKNRKAGYNFLSSKTKDSNSSRFKKILEKMVAVKFIGSKANQYFIMPRGIERVEKERLLIYSN